MKRALGFAVALALVASTTASAGLVKSGATAPTQPSITSQLAVDSFGAPRAGPICDVDISGSNSWDVPQGDPDNEVLLIDLAACRGKPSGTPMVVNGVGWDTVHQALGFSWLQEAAIDFSDSSGPGLGFFLQVSGTGNNGGNLPEANSSGGGVLKLANFGIPDVVLPDGILRLEFFETYDDIAGAIDANWLAGSVLHVQTPEPATLTLLGLGALALIRRRR